MLYTITTIIIGLGVKLSLERGLYYQVPGHEISMDHEVTSRK
jgi:hypothetical protein